MDSCTSYIYLFALLPFLPQSLHRPPAEVNKFFGCELGAQTTYNEKDDRAVVNGAHTDPALQQMVHRYVEKFVLCPQCGLPETEYKIKNDIIYHCCAACGAKEMVPDMGHRLAAYILSQHKKNKKASSSNKGKEKKKELLEKKKSKDADDGGSGDDKASSKKKKKKKKSSSSDDDEGKSSKKEKKEKKEKKSKKDKKEKKSKSNGSVNDDESIGDVAAEGSNDEAVMEEAVKATKEYLETNPEASVDEIVEVVVNQQMASALKSFDKIQILLRATITENFFEHKEIEKVAPIVSKITNGSNIMERHLIAALEGLCISRPKVFPVMIKQFYDEDALEEDNIIEWAGEGRTDFTLDKVDEDTRAALRAEADPVVNWLMEDSDSDDSDSD